MPIIEIFSIIGFEFESFPKMYDANGLRKQQLMKIHKYPVTHATEPKISHFLIMVRTRCLTPLIYDAFIFFILFAKFHLMYMPFINYYLQ